jgi:hypothetical protein
MISVLSNWTVSFLLASCVLKWNTQTSIFDGYGRKRQSIYPEFRGLLQEGFRILQIFLLDVSVQCRQFTGRRADEIWLGIKKSKKDRLLSPCHKKKSKNMSRVSIWRLGWNGRCNSLFHLLSTWSTWFRIHTFSQIAKKEKEKQKINKCQEIRDKIIFFDFFFFVIWEKLENFLFLLNSQQVWIRNQVDHAENKWNSELHLPFQPSHMDTRPDVSTQKVIFFKSRSGNSCHSWSLIRLFFFIKLLSTILKLS